MQYKKWGENATGVIRRERRQKRNSNSKSLEKDKVSWMCRGEEHEEKEDEIHFYLLSF